MDPKVILIPCAASEWRGQGRLLGRAELDVAPAGMAELSDWVNELRPLALSRIFHSPDALAKATAQYIGNALDVSVKADSGLREVDLGLWSGLTETELKSRYSKAHRQLREAPLTVSPPGGEEVGLAAERLAEVLRKRVKRNGKPIGIVLRPLSFALARVAFGEAEPKAIWSAREAAGPIVINREQAQTAVSGS
jgi:probable phosphoglycerate mutase